VRLLGAAHVRNEADIVEAFVRHNLVLLDGIAIVPITHRSTRRRTSCGR
jgi:hypothetical protein